MMALARLGAVIEIDGGYVVASAPGGLMGAEIVFPKVTVGGTHTAMMAAALARGTTVIENAAREPEIADVADCLNKMGARIRRRHAAHREIEGVAKLNGARHAVLPDRIETGTYAMASPWPAATCCCKTRVRNCCRRRSTCCTQTGVTVTPTNQGIRVARNGIDLQPVDVTTAPFPAFPTDLQAQLMALMTRARGTSHIVETMFENRFMHVQELVRLGARIQLRRAGDHRRRRAAQGRAGHGDRLARLGVAGHRRARRRGRDHRQPRLSPRPRLRAARGQAQPLRRRHRAAVGLAEACSFHPAPCGPIEGIDSPTRTLRRNSSVKLTASVR
jgi:UDP-N-acetylglucosamine 1-carboxyvinyltransferase